jgi:hypothetical protein
VSADGYFCSIFSLIADDVGIVASCMDYYFLFLFI